VEISPASEANFFIKVNGAQLTLLKNAAGAVTGMVHHEEGIPDLTGRKVR
jgi:hypothetical protein